MLKLLAFNASPRKADGTTDVLVDRFIEGAGEAGAEIEKHYVVDLDINGCLGCFGCWWKTPGRCVQRDDMDWILPGINESDILVLGTPIYSRNTTHYLQRLVERTFLNTLPEMYIEDGTTRHPRRTKRMPRIVLAATCGFPDLVNFDIVRGLYPVALHILLPASQILLDDEGREYLSDFLDAVRLAGGTMARGEEISGSLRERLIFDYPEKNKKLIVERHNLYLTGI
ncbi:MAG: flavodoxin family protein [Candidatus Bathyarchaeota archaeon]|nr:MAG: flavodoxin family protein [Candidatus Bathyarchaeota archaeon]